MRIKVERKIASSETISVRRVKGKGSTCGMPGIELKTSQLPNQITFTHTNVMLPQKLEILSARRSVCVLCSLAASSRRVTVSTFCSVNCSAERIAGPAPFGVSRALTGSGSFFIDLQQTYCLWRNPLVEPHSNESVSAPICRHNVTLQLQCLMFC